jgi:hypothetical protein
MKTYAEGELIKEMVFKHLIKNDEAIGFIVLLLGKTSLHILSHITSGALSDLFNIKVIFLVGDDIDASVKIREFNLMPRFREHVKKLLNSRKSLIVLIDNGIKTFKLTNGKWQGYIELEPTLMGRRVNEILRDAPIIMAIAQYITRHGSLFHIGELEENPVYVLTKPIYVYRDAINNPLGSLTTELSVLNTTVDDITNRRVICFFVASGSISMGKFEEGLKSQLKTSNVMMIGGNLTYTINIMREPFIAYTLLLRLKPSDKLGPQFEFMNGLITE